MKNSTDFLSRRSFVAGAAALGTLGILGATGCAQGKPSASSQGQTEAGAAPAPKDAKATYDTDLLIVGCGGSGLACAVQAGIDGTNCLVIETSTTTGGNAQGVEGMFAINSSMQKALGIDAIAPADIIAGQMKELQYGVNGADWVEFCEASTDNIDWCLEQGVEYNGVVDNYFTGDVATMHWFKDGSCGAGYVPQMTKRLKDLGVEVHLGTTATDLVRDDSGAVVGVYAEGEEGCVLYNAKAVVLATGGFATDLDLIAKQGWDTTGMDLMGPGVTGGGYRMAVAAGAFDDMASTAQSIAPSIAAFPLTDYKKDPMNPINGLPGIAGSPFNVMVDQFGDRFLREDASNEISRSSCYLATKRNAATYIVFDDAIYRQVFATDDAAREMFETSLANDDGSSLATADTIEALAENFGIDPEALNATIERYNESCRLGVDRDFSKAPELMLPIAEAPFYMARLAFDYYFSTGGLLIDKYQRVWDADKQPIAGLYAIGNDGNNHYASVYTINIPGTAFGHQVNSGRKAASVAKEYIASLS